MMYRQICGGKFEFEPALHWATISPAAKDLIARLLQVAPTSRATAKQVLQHPWLVPGEAARDHARLSSATRQLDLFDEFSRKILRRGHLVKRGAVVKSWRRRLFVLTGVALQYFDDQREAVEGEYQPYQGPKRIISLGDITDVRVSTLLRRASR